MMKNIAKALTPVAAAFGAAAIALTPANDANAQTILEQRDERISFRIGTSINVEQYGRAAFQNNQTSLAKFNFVEFDSQGQRSFSAGYITVNRQTGVGWILKGNGPIGASDRFTPILQINNLVFFNPNTPRSGLNNLTNASPAGNRDLSPSDCTRWEQSLRIPRNIPGYVCRSKEAQYRSFNNLSARIATAGSIINSRESTANVLVISLYEGENQPGFIGVMGNNTYITYALIRDYENLEPITNDLNMNRDGLISFISRNPSP